MGISGLGWGLQVYVTKSLHGTLSVAVGLLSNFRREACFTSLYPTERATVGCTMPIHFMVTLPVGAIEWSGSNNGAPKRLRPLDSPSAGVRQMIPVPFARIAHGHFHCSFTQIYRDSFRLWWLCIWPQRWLREALSWQSYCRVFPGSVCAMHQINDCGGNLLPTEGIDTQIMAFIAWACFQNEQNNICMNVSNTPCSMHRSP